MVKSAAEVKEENKKRKREPLALNRGAWTAKEDQKLVEYIANHGDKNWNTLPAKAGLNRCGKSCRLRWLNYLRPGIKRGNISEEEEDLIIRLHNLIGNRWSLIAGRLPGRTDNEIKNHWNTHLSKRSLSIHELNTKITSQTAACAAAAGGGCIEREELQYCDDPCAAASRCHPEHMPLHSPAGDQQLLYVVSSSNPSDDGAGERLGIGDYDVTDCTNYGEDYLFDTWSISFVDQLYSPLHLELDEL